MITAILALSFLVVLLWYRVNTLVKRNESLESAILVVSENLEYLTTKHNDLCAILSKKAETDAIVITNTRDALAAASMMLSIIADEQDDLSTRTDTIEDHLGFKGK